MSNRINLSYLFLLTTLLAFFFNAIGLHSQLTGFRQRIDELESEVNRKNYSDISLARDPVATALRQLNEADPNKYAQTISILLRNWEKFIRSDTPVELSDDSGKSRTFVLRKFLFKQFTGETSPAFVAILINEEHAVVDSTFVVLQTEIISGQFHLTPRRPSKPSSMVHVFNASTTGHPEMHPVVDSNPVDSAEMLPCELTLIVSEGGDANNHKQIGWHVGSAGFDRIPGNPAIRTESPDTPTQEN